MTDSSVTQCPHCRTRFRVSPAQLEAARGAVRCGACLQVFNALEHLIGATQPAPLKGEPVMPASAQEAPDNALIQDDMDLDLDGLEEELARLEQNEKGASGQLPEAADTADAWHQEQIAATTETAEGVAQSEEPAPAEESLAGEPEAAGDIHAQVVPSPDAAADQQQTDAPEDESKPQEQELFDLSSEPLHLDWQAPHRPWGRWIGWGLLNLLAASALAGQYVAYNFETLARQDRLRPWFEQLCPQLGCTVPAKVDTTQLKSSNLVVRDHPQFSGALVVDAIIYNRAAFSQPFPLLKLSFTDMQGQLLASRRFKPSEYLGGELAGKKDMPPQTPIHIALDILDPGQQAMNYRLEFESPE